jgi:hypothetical protein
MKLLSAILLLASCRLGAESFAGAGLSQALQGIPASARSESLGGCFTGQPDQVEGVLYNPATLNELQSGQVSLHHQSWLADVYQETVITGLPNRRLGGFAVLANFVDYGTFNGMDASGQVTQPINANDLGLGISYGTSLFGPFSGGLSLKYLRETLADQSYQVFSGDAGFLFSRGPYRLSMAALNLGPGMGPALQSSVLNLDISRVFFPRPSVSLLACSGLSYEVGAYSRVQLGCEAGLAGHYFLRLGYNHDFQVSDLQGLSELSIGFGMQVAAFTLDYSYRPYGELGDTQRLSLAYSFAPASQPKRTQESAAVGLK